MNEQYIEQIKNTLVVMLKARNRADELGLLTVAVRWEPRVINNDNYYDDTDLRELGKTPFRQRFTLAWIAIVFLCWTIRSNLTLNEITAAHRDAFVSVRFYPELVSELSLTQEQLMEWLGQRFGPDDIKKLVATGSVLS